MSKPACGGQASDIFLCEIATFVIIQGQKNEQGIHPPLSNIQVELLKLFPADIPDKQLKELKELIAKFLLDKARDKADAIWDKKGYSDEKVLKLPNKK